MKPGLRLVEFSLYIAPSLRQARRAQGCLFAEVRPADGRYFSLTAWESPAAMKRYARSWPHRIAMARAAVLATESRFHHFHAEGPPDWTDALARWRAAGLDRAA
ncbi:MAG: hypothetical protein QNJ16_05235 [Rhodobacter sp.]|nr:hypothetical protein [Rhodobacter sp.]